MPKVHRLHLLVTCCLLVTAVWQSTSAIAAGSGKKGERTSRISLESVSRFDFDSIPERPKPILELGNDFLGPGNIRPGWELPSGAVWQPSLVVFGTYRTALQTFYQNDRKVTEWANRLDVFANLQLSGSERFILGIRPLDEDGQFTSYQFEPDEPGDKSGFNDAYNHEVTTFFFEGDFGEIFPNIDPSDRARTDLGFAIGRQPLNLQDGMLINDNVDSIGITRNTLLPKNGSDLQVTLFYGWNDVHRDDNIEGDNHKLWAIAFALDRRKSTNNFDIVYIDDPDGKSDGVFWGFSDVRRVGHLNLSTRVLGSHALNDESSAVSDGNLLFAELSWSPAWTHDHVYTNLFVGVEEYASAARGPATGGPLGRTGILFQAVGLGRYGAPLGNRADNAIGIAFGYQKFFDPVVNQIIFEIGSRRDTEEERSTAMAMGIRYRHVISSHIVLQADAFGALNNDRGEDFGVRLEMRVEF